MSVTTRYSRRISVRPSFTPVAPIDLAVQDTRDARSLCSYLTHDQAREIADELYAAAGSPAEPEAPEPEPLAASSAHLDAVDQSVEIARILGLDPARVGALSLAVALLPNALVEDHLQVADWLVAETPRPAAEDDDESYLDELDDEDEDTDEEYLDGGFYVIDSDGDRLDVHNVLGGALFSTEDGPDVFLDTMTALGLACYLDQQVGSPDESRFVRPGLQVRPTDDDGELVLFSVTAPVFLTEDDARDLATYLRSA